MEPTGSWEREGRYVMHTLRRHEDSLEAVQAEVDKLKMEQAAAAVRQGLWGAVGSALPVVGYFLFELFKRG